MATSQEKLARIDQVIAELKQRLANMEALREKILNPQHGPTHVVVCQPWEERERGWGSRPDGYSLHVRYSDIEIFVKAYWDDMPDEPQDEYCRPYGTPYECAVTQEEYDTIAETPHGKRYFADELPDRLRLAPA